MIIESSRIWIDDVYRPAQVVIKDKKIMDILAPGTAEADISYGDLRVIPGMIDVHCHGAYGYDTCDGTPEGLRYWQRHIAEEGVTSLLPTTVTEAKQVLENALANVAAVMAEDGAGAEILGVHLEGPFISPAYRGAQPEAAIAVPSVDVFRHYQNCAGGVIRYVTLAPELEQAIALVRYCADSGIVVSLGHSAASYETACQAVTAGATSVTHVFNGMKPMHHRDPGLVGAALSQPTLYGEIIADGHHVHPSVVNTFFRCKGDAYALLVTDALRVKYARSGDGYTLGGQAIEVHSDGLAYIRGNGTIAGSTLRMNKGLQFLIEQAGVDEISALHACTLNPARCLHVDDRKGRIASGFDADLVVLDDDYEVVQTYCRGQRMLETVKERELSVL